MEENNKPQALSIDIDKMLAARKVRLPRFIVNYIKRIIHQEELNAWFAQVAGITGFEFGEKGIAFMGAKYTVEGLENVPTSGRFVFASNHPLGGIDGVAFLLAVSRIYPNVKIVANDILMVAKPLEPLFLGVNKHGITAREGIKLFDEALQSDIQVLFFPAGLISRKTKGIVKDLEWKKTFLTKAIQTQRDIIPVHISGNVSEFFYRLSNFRKFFGIKTNLEMFYLVDETFRQKGKTITLTFGKPISYKVFDKSMSQEQWSQKIKEHVYSLPNNKNQEFNL